jgi:hypothetical protein
MNLLGSKVQIPLSNSVALSMMVVCLLTFIALGVIMSISNPLCCIFFNGHTPTSSTYPSFASLCVATCLSTNCCSTSSSSNSWMHIGSTSVVHGLLCSLELKPLFRLHKNSIVDVLDLYIFWIMECAICIFSWYYFLSSHSEDDGECNNLTTNN